MYITYFSVMPDLWDDDGIVVETMSRPISAPGCRLGGR